MSNDFTDNDILNKISSLKSALDDYQSFSDYIVKQTRDYYNLVPLMGAEYSYG